MAQWMHRHARLSHGRAKPLSSVFELAAGDTAARTVMQEWLSDGLKMQCDWAIRIVQHQPSLCSPDPDHDAKTWHYDSRVAT